MIFEGLFFVTVVAILARALAGLEERVQATSAKRQASPRLTQALDYADRLYSTKRFHAAEKAYLAVLKLDHKNLSAYTHLGIIYHQLKNYPDAIECFLIATQLGPSASSYYSLGVVYYENRDYTKAVAAHEKAIMFEPTSTRYVALGKAHQQAHNLPQMVVAVEQAATLDPENVRTLRLLLDGYLATKDRDKARELALRIHSLEGSSRSAARQKPKSDL